MTALDATREAWLQVLDGVERALSVPDVPPVDRARLLRMRAQCIRLTGRRLIEAVRP